VVAAVYFVFGHYWIVVKVIGALLSALSVPAAASIGDSLGGRRLAEAAIAFRPPTIRRVVSAGVLIACAVLLRPVLGISALVMRLAPAIDWARRRGQGLPLRGRTRLSGLLVGLPALPVVSSIMAARYLPTLDASTASGTAPAADAAPVTLGYSFSPSGFLRALLGSCPWSFGPTSGAIYRALYPGMLVWILIVPAMALGCWELLRRGPWAARGLVVSALAFLYAFHRHPHRIAIGTAAGAYVVAPAALVQAHVLSLDDLGLLAAALASVWWIGRVALRRVYHVIRRRGRVRQALIRTGAHGGRGG
jgi:hypothetical protein